MATAPPPSPPDEDRKYRVGELVGQKYELVRLLGEGGMGSVWCARNLSLDSLVALKLLRSAHDDEEDADRLLQEARAAARLGHRAIVRVFDFGHTEQGDPFIVMELLEGESLSIALHSRTRFSAVKSVQILLPIVDALAAAHAEGIVHRDLKPENIFLVKEARRTQPKVVDFGIAKVEGSGFTRTLTRKGAVLGSPGYMSPEQARGLARVDHRVDVWGVCVVLYECVTGQSPFQGENYNALMRAIIEDPVVPVTSFSAGDDALWAILERGLRKDPEARWSSMRELGSALAKWLLSHGVEQDVSGDSLGGWAFAEEPASSAPPAGAPPGGPGVIRPQSATRRWNRASLLSSFARGPSRLAVLAAGTAAVVGAVWWGIASSRTAVGTNPASPSPPQRVAAEGAPSAAVAAPVSVATPATDTHPEASAPPAPVTKERPPSTLGRREKKPPAARAEPHAADLKDPYGSVP